MQAVIYARVSSREQEQEGYSIPAQLKLLREYAQRHDFTVLMEFIDVQTAKVSGRKQFAAMVELLKKNRGCQAVLVEKTDRLYRNFRDAVTLEELRVELHLVKEGQVISEDAKSQAKLMHGIQVVLARNYVENQREEVKKGLREKAEQGIYPGRAPFGYKNNRNERSIELHPENAPIIKRIFELYATGQFPLTVLRKQIHKEFGKEIARAYLYSILKNPAYIGTFQWAGKTYSGNHPRLITTELFDTVQAIMRGHNKGKYRKNDIAFRGMLRCAEDGSTVTAELKKGKYVYYRCTGYRGKCGLPRFREADLAERLGEVLKDIHIPDSVLGDLQAAITRDHEQMQRDRAMQKQQLARQLEAIRHRMDQAYTDKLDGRIPEDFWQRKLTEWQLEEQRNQQAISHLREQRPDRLLNVRRILELANKAYFLYLTQKPSEQAKLLRMVLLNCTIDAVSVYPTYRKPFDLIFQRAKNEEWSGRPDLNRRPLAPQASALPGCATSRRREEPLGVCCEGRHSHFTPGMLLQGGLPSLR